jgi:hypothetical protein
MRDSDMLVSTRCLGCGHKVTEPIRWFQLHGETCPACGQKKLDTEPLRRLAVFAVKSLQNEARRRK